MPQTAANRLSHDPIIGREREIQRLAAGIREAEQGRGGLFLLYGEPGIGKSRLAEECERLARGAQFSCAWGRCWESGGAPAYWPWSQAIRTLQRFAKDDGADARRLAAWLADGDGALGGGGGRFELFEAVGQWLAASADQQPLWLCIEDLHAADPASLALLEALVPAVRGARLMLVATVRDAAITASPMCATYRRIARQAESLALGRLDVAASRSLLAEQLDFDESTMAVAVDATGGLPLFLVELVRLAQRSGERADPMSIISAGMADAMRYRLNDLSADALRVLTAAALIGMDVERGVLDHGFGRDAVAAALVEGQRCSLVRRLGSHGWRFAHALLRDVLVDGLEPDEARSLHATIATWLEATAATNTARAHHLHRAGPSHRGAAITTALAAARDSLARYAYEDAQLHLAAARDGLGPSGDTAQRATVSTLEGLALIGLARVDDGLALCVRGAELARAANAPVVWAEAALAYGSVYRFATIDRRLVRMLEEALAALPAGDSAIRAKVLARLAAARQPDPEPARPIALAKEAIAMAERIGDVAVRAATLRAGCSALVDMADPRERRELDQRHFELAVEHGLDTDVLHARRRLVLDCMELGDFASARSHIHSLDELLRSGAHPRHRWLVPALEVLVILWEGWPRGDTRVRTLIEEVRSLGQACDDRNAKACYDHQIARWIELTGDTENVDDVAEALGRLFEGSPVGERFSHMRRAHFLLQVGQTERGVAAIARDEVVAVLADGDRTMLLPAAQWAAASGDRALGEDLLERLAPDAALFVADGVSGMCWRSPVSLVLAHAARAAGDPEAALAWAKDAEERARSVAGVVASVEASVLAMVIAEELGDERAAAEHRERAEAGIEKYDLAGLGWPLSGQARTAELAERSVDRSTADARGSAPPERATLPTFDHEGDVWRIAWRGRVVRVKSTKGVAVIAHLVAQPRVPVHVLELAHLGQATPAIDVGDAGELIDAEALSAYRTRRVELSDDLAEAEANHDLGRVERLRAQLEQIEEELARGMGIGGRQRRSPGAEERARQAVRKQVRTAIKLIAGTDPELAKFLERATSTGRLCQFDP